ncbi:unnamed protein product [Absidia cylindrospora]
MLSKTYFASLTILSSLATLPTLLYAQCTNSTTPSPAERYFYNLASANDNKLYMFGGSLARSSYDVWSLDLTQQIDTGCPPWNQAFTSNVTNSMSPYVFGIAFNPNNQNYIFVQGGDAVNTTIQQSIIGYDTTQNKYTLPAAPVGEFMSSRSRMATAVDSVNNKVWVTGGRNTFEFDTQGTLTDAYSDIYSYQFGNNPGSLSVQKAAVTSHYGTPIGRFGHSTTLIDNKLFILGGYTTVSQNKAMVIDFASTTVFDIQSSTVVSMDTIGDIPAGRTAFSAVASRDGQSIIVFGGIMLDTLQTVTNDVYILDTCTLTWKKQFINEHSQGRAAHQSYMHGKYMITMNGISGHNGNATTPNDSMGILDTDTWTWVTTTEAGYSPSSSDSPQCSYAFPSPPTENSVIGTSPKTYDNTVISNPWASHDALTTPEKGGIGVGVPLFVIACLGAAFFFYRRRQRNKSRQLNPRWMPGALSSSSNAMSGSTGATDGHQQRNDYPLFTYNNNTDTTTNQQGGLRTYTATDHDQWERQLIQDNERPQSDDDKAMARHEDVWTRMRGLHAPGDEERH